jgi:hypothetical protein
MAKSFKKFREQCDDDWSDDSDDKDRELQKRRDQRRKKTAEKFSRFDEKADD